MEIGEFSLPSFAKINLYLKVLGKRADGYHELCTVFQTVSLSDTITFLPSDELKLSCDNENIPIDGSNLILKAAKALRDLAGTNKGAELHLEKKIPSPGGLGGGSSNAAVALIGLRKLWGLDISDAELAAIGGKLGSDVPFFFIGGTALGTGTGRDVEAMSDANLDDPVITTPNIAVSTATAYHGLMAESLTKEEMGRNLLVCRKWAETVRFQQEQIVNDFEKTVFRTFPEIAVVKNKLIELGAVTAGMSGSGASVFGIFDNKETRQTAMKALGEIPNWRSFAVAAVSRHEYRKSLGIG